MAIRAKRDEIIFCVLARVAAKLLVMHFEVLPRSAELAAPAVASQYTLAQIFVLASVEADWYLLVQ
jgi:hypothetical protein